MASVNRLLQRCAVMKTQLSGRRASVLTSVLSCREKQTHAGTSLGPPEEKERYSDFLKRNVRMWGQEIYDKVRCSNLDIMFDTSRSLWHFSGPENFKDFQVITDENIGGKSLAQVDCSRNNKLLFHGNLCTTVPRDGETARSGFCSLKSRQQFGSFNRKKHIDLTPFNSLNLRLRGDGRAYMVNIQTEGYYTDYHDDLWSYFLFTRGGPYWQDVSIPFSKFFLSSRGRIQDRQAALDLEMVNTVGLTMADAIDGEFAVEIDSIWASYDATHTEDFAYEVYRH